MNNIRLENITVEGRLEHASAHITQGELTIILGPNGAGKTTLLKTAMGLIKPDVGDVFYGSRNAARVSPTERARKISYLPQSRPMAWPNIVRDVVALGRYPYGASPARLSPNDAQIVDTAIQSCGISHLTKRRADTLSGGEAARMHCARAFAAQTPFLIADEPVAALDPRHQFRIMDLIARFVGAGGGALIVLHNVALAAQYADRIIWMKDARIIGAGTPEETLTPQRLAQIYGVSGRVEGREVYIDAEL